MDNYKAIIEALRNGRLNVSAGGGSGPQDGIGYGGRVGYAVPVGEGEVNLGMAGGGIYSKDMKKAMINSLDAEYKNGAHAFGAEFRKAQPNSPEMLMLKYRRSF